MGFLNLEMQREVDNLKPYLAYVLFGIDTMPLHPLKVELIGGCLTRPPFVQCCEALLTHLWFTYELAAIVKTKRIKLDQLEHLSFSPPCRASYYMFEMLCTRYSHTSIGDIFGVGLIAQIYKNLKNFIKDLTNASRERERR